MNIINDFNDKFIYEYNPNEQYTSINLDLLISKKILEISISSFILLNEFIIENHLSSKHNQHCEIDVKYEVSNHSEFYKINIKISFENITENKHSQVIRDGIYELIFGYTSEYLMNDDFKEKLYDYLNKLKNERAQNNIWNKNKFLNEKLLKHNMIDSDGNSIKYDEYLHSEFTVNNAIKKYKNALKEIRLYCFQKNMYISYGFENYVSFFNKIFYSVNSISIKKELIHKNMHFSKINRLKEKNILFSVYSIISDKVIIQNLSKLFLIVAVDKYYSYENSIDKEFEFRKYNIEDNTIFIQYNKSINSINNFENFFIEFVDYNFLTIKNNYINIINQLLINKKYLDILYLLDFSKIKYETISEGLDILLDIMNSITPKVIKDTFVYKNMI